MTTPLNRREFIKNTALSTGLVMASAALTGCQGYAKRNAQDYRSGFAAPAMDKVRIGFIGVGNRGPGHVRNLLKLDNIQIKAICDIRHDRVEKTQKMVEDAGRPRPDGYSNGDEDYKQMCQRDDLDLVYIATPWRWHAAMCIEAMNNGKHAAVEVPAVVTMEECWQIVDTAERTNRHCIILENCCYDRVELMILNMVRQGVLGELTHAECGYLHDLRGLKYGQGYQGRWRIDHSVRRNGDLYPTHGLGPVAQDMNINRGGQFDHLVAMATKSRGLNLYEAKARELPSTKGTTDYALGDVVTTLIKTKAGETIVITHDTNSPRPYSRDILVQGTKGIVRKYPKTQVHIEGMSQGHGWEDVDAYFEKYDHPYYKTLKGKAKGGGHGGMDFVMNYRLIECLTKGLPMDMDVYDAAAWSVVSELSERSIAKGSVPVKIPDFTRGKWKTRKPLGIIQG
jgi:predicted dehydrogenase